MRAIKFKHCNIVFAEDQPEYTPLPALKINSTEGHMITCWKLTWRERIKVLFSGLVWHSLMTFNKPPMPQYMSVYRQDVYTHPDFKDYERVKNEKEHL